jgi:hypothetical protein
VLLSVVIRDTYTVEREEHTDGSDPASHAGDGVNQIVICVRAMGNTQWARSTKSNKARMQSKANKLHNKYYSKFATRFTKQRKQKSKMLRESYERHTTSYSQLKVSSMID